MRVRNVGESVIIEVELKDLRNRPISIVGGLSLSIETPAKIWPIGPFTMTLDSVGMYRYTYVPTAPGIHKVRVFNNGEVVHEQYVTIKESKMGEAPRLYKFPIVYGIGETAIFTFSGIDGVGDP